MTERARVPFALVGVLLLVTSGTVAVTHHGVASTEPTVDREMDRLTAESHTAIRAAVREAVREAARRPVLSPANSSTGRALDQAKPFRDALRLRIALAAREKLTALSEHRRGVDLVADLPPGVREEGVRAAIELVDIARAGPDGHRLRVNVSGVRLRASRDGRTVGETAGTRSVVVDSPILELHDRVERFDQRLNAYVGESGLASTLTGVLYPIAWMRGYTQFRGGPVENVVSNRHVALVTNAAVIQEQRTAFGSADPVGRNVLTATVANTAISGLLSRSGSKTLQLLDQYRGTVGLDRVGDEALGLLEPDGGVTRPDDTMTVDVGEAADLAALRAFRSINDTLDRAYRPQVRVRADVETHDRRTVDTHDAVPGGTLDGRRTVYDATVFNRSGTPPASPVGWHRLDGHSRRVVVEETTIFHWEISENESETTTSTDRIVKRVDLVVEANHAVGPAPAGRVTSVHERGGPFDGPNLVDVRAQLLARGVTSRGGPDALAARAALGRLDERSRAVQAPRAPELASWASPDLAPLRREVRAIRVEVSRGAVASFQVNVPRRLAEKLRAQRASLVDAPPVYDSVAHRARVGVRAAYVDRVLALLEERAAGFDTGREHLDDELNTQTGPGSDVLADAFDARGGGGDSGATDLAMVVDASPSYLTVQPVGHDAVPAIPEGEPEEPLAVRNVEVFGLPTGDLVDELFGLLEGTDRTSLRSAARVLSAARAADNRSGPVDTEALRGQVRRTEALVRLAMHAALARHGLGDRDGRSAAVQQGLSGWNGTAARAAAIANGSAATAVHDVALERWSGELDSAPERERLAIALRFAASAAREVELVQPAQSTVNRTAGRVSDGLGYASEATRAALTETARSRVAPLVGSLPEGLPVVPGPGTWYTTVNLWRVQVRGSYARFAVRVRRGAPDVMPPDLTYVRENRTVTLDVDGDETLETLGYNHRVEFAAETAIGVAVPPKPQGVGDVVTRDERSPGWPAPGAGNWTAPR